MYSHAFCLMFTVTSEQDDGSDVTAAEMRTAIRKWVDEVHDIDLLTNCDAPVDSYLIED